MKLVKNLDWKYEFELWEGDRKLIRFKIYDKTADKLTSKGVKNDIIGDPFPWLTLIQTHNSKYNSSLVQYNGFALCRLEVTFYGT